MIIRWLLYLGCWVAMSYVAFAILWFIVTVKCVMRYAPWIDAELIKKASDVAIDNMILPNWGSNKIVRFIGDKIIEPIAWPVCFIANIDNLYKDTMTACEELLAE